VETGSTHYFGHYVELLINITYSLGDNEQLTDISVLKYGVQYRVFHNVLRDYENLL
jgi:hypothetical protein